MIWFSVVFCALLVGATLAAVDLALRLCLHLLMEGDL